MALRARGPLGKQYARLSAYAASIGGGLELCVHTDDLAEVFLRDHVRRVEDDAGGYWRLAEGTTGDLALFTPFRFPLLDITKVRMKQAAAALGVLDLMAGTWFCHKPRGEQPCGACAPCTYTIKEGMGERLPRRAHARYWIVRARRATGTMARRLRLR